MSVSRGGGSTTETRSTAQQSTATREERRGEERRGEGRGGGRGGEGEERRGEERRSGEEREERRERRGEEGEERRRGEGEERRGELLRLPSPCHISTCLPALSSNSTTEPNETESCLLVHLHLACPPPGVKGGGSTVSLLGALVAAFPSYLSICAHQRLAVGLLKYRIPTGAYILNSR